MENFDNLMDYRFTANMEEELDKVAHGQAQWDAVLNEFYGDFSGKLVTAKDVENGMRDNALRTLTSFALNRIVGVTCKSATALLVFS